MPIYSVQGPDGRIYDIEGPKGASDAQVISALQDYLASQPPPAKPKTGIGAAIGQGVEQLISSGRTAYGALTGSPEEAAQAGLARGEDIGKRYEDQVSLQKVKDVYAARGILPAAGEAISQIPAAIAQQAPNLASMAGSARLGAMAGSPLGPIGSIVGGVAGAALPSLIQQFGGNVERQASEQQKAGRPISIDVGAAGAAAVPQAGLDIAGNLIPFGGRIITKLTGIPMQALLGRTAAQATKLADEKLLATLSKGIGVGALAEIPTEIAQQMLERAQAGLSLSDADAMKEYGETAYQVGLLAPLGAVGRLSERSGARMDIEQQQALEKRKARMDAMQAEAAAQQTPVVPPIPVAPEAPVEEDLVALTKRSKPNVTPDMYGIPKDFEAEKIDPRVAAQQAATDQEELLKENKRKQAELTDKLAELGRIIPDTQAQMNAALSSNDMNRVGLLAKQLMPLVDAENNLKGELKKINAVIGPEFNVDDAAKALQKAATLGDYNKVAALAKQIDAYNKEQATLKETTTGAFGPEIKKIPSVQEDLFGPALTEREKAGIESQGTLAEAQQEPEDKKRQTQQTALFEQGEEQERELTEREVGKEFELTPEQYTKALLKDPSIAAAQTAIDSGFITADVRRLLGLKGLGNADLDLSNKNHRNVATAILQQKMAGFKGASEELTNKFVNNPFAENELYDKNGKLTEDAKNILRRDAQAEELQRLLDHVNELNLKERGAFAEDRRARDLVAVTHKREVVSTELPLMESMDVKDKNELSQALGVSGETQLKQIPADRVSAMRHTIEAKRQRIAHEEAYGRLLEILDSIKRSNAESHPLDAKRLATLRTAYVKAVLSEAAHRRASERRPGITAAEAMTAANKLHTALKELSTRYLAKTELTEVVGYKPFAEEKINEAYKAWKAAPEITLDQIQYLVDNNLGDKIYTARYNPKQAAFEKYSELVDRFVASKAPIVNKLKARQLELVRLREGDAYRVRVEQRFLKPLWKKWQAMPDGQLGTAEHAAKEAAQQAYLKQKQGFETNAEKDATLVAEITRTLAEQGVPRSTPGTFEKDIRSLEERPFAKPARAVEVIKEQLDEVAAGLVGERKVRAVSVAPIERVQNALNEIKKAQAELDGLKNKQKVEDKRAALVERIDRLKERYNTYMEQQEGQVQPPSMPTTFTERRNEIDEVKQKLDAALAAIPKGQELLSFDELNEASKQLKRLQELGLSEKTATELGESLEYQQTVIARAIKDAKKELDDLMLKLKPAMAEVSVGEKVPPKSKPSVEQLQRVKELNTQLNQLEPLYEQNKKALQDVGLFAASEIDFKTQDMFEAAPELGSVFDTPEQFLGSSTYGKIAKLRKQARTAIATLPVTHEELQRARTAYVAALTVLQNLRKMRTALPTPAQYFSEVSAEYTRQADAAKDRGLAALASSTGLASWHLSEEKRFRQLASDAEARSKSFFLTLNEEQLDLVRDIAKEGAAQPESVDALQLAQKAVDDAKTVMEDTDKRAKEKGIIKPPPIPALIKVQELTSLEKANKRVGEIGMKLATKRQELQKAAVENRVPLQYEIEALQATLDSARSEAYMLTAEGRIARLTESFFEEFNPEIDPANPLKNAFGRALARSQEYIPDAVKQKPEEIEQLRKERGTVIDALAKLSKAQVPVNKSEFLEFNMNVFDLKEKLNNIDESIRQLEEAIVTAQEAEISFLARADGALKDAWAKLKKAEAELKASDEKKAVDIALRKAALIRSQKIVDDARARIRINTEAIDAKIATGFGLPGMRVKRVKAASEAGRVAAGPRTVGATETKTTNPGWTVTYTDDGVVFSYDPAKDPDATEQEKAIKNTNFRKTYDQLKKARSALTVAKKGGDALAIEAASRKLEGKQSQLENLAGARYVTAVETIGAQPTEVDALLEVQQAVANLPKESIKAYYQARGEQERLRKEIVHVRELKGQMEISNARTAVRNAQNALESKETPLRLLQDAWNNNRSNLSETAYKRRVDALTTEIATTRTRLEELQTRLKPMEVKNETRLKELTDAYFAAKSKADAFLLPKAEEQIKAERAPLAENVADIAKTARTMSVQERTGSDIKPLVKRNVKLKAGTDAEGRIYKTAMGLAKRDRMVTMHPKGSTAYNTALSETANGYFDSLTSEDSVPGTTVYRIESGAVTNPVDAVQAQQAAKEFAKGLPKDVKFIYAPTMGEAPLKFLNALAKDGIDVESSTVKGGVMADGTIVVIGNMHTSLKDLEYTLVHEAIGHYGVDIVLGPKGMADLTQAIRTSEGGILGMAKALGLDKDVIETARAWEAKAVVAELRGDTTKASELRRTGEMQTVREMLAHLQERTVDESFVAKAGRYIKVILGAIRNLFKRMGFVNTASVSTNDLYYTLFQASRKMQQEFAGSYMSPTGLLALKATYANPGLARAGEIGDTFIAKDRSTLDRVRAASGGFLGMETMLVDRFAGFERLSKTMEALKGSQMMYYLRMYDQRMNFVSQAVSNGALQIVEKTRSDGRKEFLVESKSGPSIAGVVNILKDSPAGSADAANRLFTLYLAANRAKNKGIETLHFGTALTQADLNEAMTAIRATPGLEENFKLAQKEYNDYNRGLVEFLVQTGAIGKDVANRLMAENDYIPFYRERGGLAELVIGNEPPIRIGSIAEQPYLKELVGGDKPILDFMTSSVQNTNLLADMGLRNLATKNAVFELVNMDLAKIGAGRGTAGPDVVRFKVDGEDRFALIDTDKAGIPADILVKGMEGIPTQLPAAFRLLGMPATLLRKAVTLSPLYAAKQLFRDSLAAPLLAGADFVPVLGALKEVGASSTKKLLEQRGITGGQIFTGTQADLTKILKDLAENKTVSWGSLIAKAEAINMEADAATRRAQYNSYIRQGLSEMEATLMSLESMNFNKRGASPSIHALNSLIPFFNAQIQSMNVLYKAITGKLPFNERLKIQEKLLTRGLMIAAGTLAYAAAMQDDEAYKDAMPEQKYGNWFVRIPGVDEPIRLPIPFEIGYIFKALPEALYNTMVDKHGGEEAVKAFRTILLSTIPGGSSYGIPQALKPAIEAGLGKSFYTGRDILSRHEQTLLPEQQFREKTSELAKAFGSLGISPIKVDALINGYTGTMGLAFAQAVGTLMPTRTAPEQAYKRLSEMPVVGGAFQPNDAGGISNSVYEQMLEFKKVKATADDMIKRGDTAGARELIHTRSNEFAASQMADQFVTTMGKLTQYEQAIRASNNTPEQKREQLDKIRQARMRFSEMTRQATDRTIPQ